MEKIKIRAIFLYEFKLGRKAAETARSINKVFGKGTASERTVQRWFRKFSDGDENLEDEEGRGRPVAVNNDNLRTMVETDPRTTIRELADGLGISHSTFLDHLKQLGKIKKLDKWVPHDLNENQKNRRYEICSANHLRNKAIHFLIVLLPVMRNGSCMITDVDLHSGWTKMKYRNTFQNRN